MSFAKISLELNQLFFLPTFLLLAGIILSYRMYFFKFKRKLEMTKNIASPPSLPLLGHAHYFVLKQPHELISTLKELLKKYMAGEKIFKIWLGPELNVLIFDTKDIKTVLSGFEHLDKAGEYDMLKPWLNEGLLLSSGRKWHRRRKVIVPTFHLNILRKFVDVFEKNSRLLIANFKKELLASSENGFDPYKWIHLCTLDAVCGE